MIKIIAFFVILLTLTGCVKKNYNVCIPGPSGTGIQCMHEPLSKTDAINVGQAISQLGFDVILKPKKTPVSVIPDLPRRPAIESYPIEPPTKL